MDITIITEQDMPLLKRKDYSLWVTHDGATPKRAMVRQEISKKLKSDKKLTIIRQISPAFGAAASTVAARIYTDEGSLQLHESAHILKRHEGEPAEEAPAEETSSKKEVPAEESAEAPKAPSEGKDDPAPAAEESPKESPENTPAPEEKKGDDE